MVRVFRKLEEVMNTKEELRDILEEHHSIVTDELGERLITALDEYIQDRESALLSRANSELPDKKEVKGYNEMAGYADFARGYNQAITEVRTKLDQLSKEKMK